MQSMKISIRRWWTKGKRFINFTLSKLCGEAMDWQPYIKASWEMVMAAEGQTKIVLDDELESYLVQMMARNFRNHRLPPDILCLELAHARRAEDYRHIGDSCLFVDAWNIRRARLVSRDYYQRLGQIDYSHAALHYTPFDAFLERVGREFKLLSQVLAGVQALRQA